MSTDATEAALNRLVDWIRDARPNTPVGTRDDVATVIADLKVATAQLTRAQHQLRQLTAEELEQKVGLFVDHMIPAPAKTYALKASKEALELWESTDTDTALVEAADVLICLIGWAHGTQVTLDQIIRAAHKKMEINLARNWRQQSDGTWQHY